jgi:GntR family transcriptional regulator/MocR family aminotransferase
MRPQHSTRAIDTLVSIDANSQAPLHQQIYDGLRDAIVSGRLRAGARLPATRMLADSLAVSRNTVILAYDELSAEGYLDRRARGGTFVALTLPDQAMRLRGGSGRSHGTNELRGPARVLSARGEIIAGMLLPASVNTESAPRAFRPGVPALDAFPAELWGRLVARHWRTSSPRSLAYGHSAGYRPLREAIASYIAVARGVRCTADEILIVGGAQQALDIATRLLLDPGDAVWLEDPGYVGARAAFMAAGARIVPVRVDASRPDVAEGERLAPEARMAFVSPSHKHPLGATMPNARREALLAEFISAGHCARHVRRVRAWRADPQLRRLRSDGDPLGGRTTGHRPAASGGPRGAARGPGGAQ